MTRKYSANPQALAAVSARKVFDGHEDLGTSVDADTWLTPRYILSELGDFDLDPCAAASNPYWACDYSFTKEQDGLRSSWKGRVFMNPPFSDTQTWLRKHSQHGNGVSLVSASVESKVWREAVWPVAKGIFLLFGRTRFCNPDGSTTTGRPLRSIALIAWTEPDATVLKNCRLAGTFLETWGCR